jgi:hypothetical protein
MLADILKSFLFRSVDFYASYELNQRKAKLSITVNKKALPIGRAFSI